MIAYNVASPIDVVQYLMNLAGRGHYLNRALTRSQVT